MFSNRYQIALIALLCITGLLFARFVYIELFPEYKIYQETYEQLEKFRSSYTGEAPPPFKIEIKQIVIPRGDNGPETIDRCISCHVALKLETFSPTKLAYDINGQPMLDLNGHSIQIPNEDYIWLKLDQKIAQFIAEGNIHDADQLKALKTAQVGDQIYDMTKVLAMHPLIDGETRPFELHPMEEYGCTSCHSGNGRGLTTDKAHGPVFDGKYEISFEGPVPQFTEPDPLNDPKFAEMFNHRPGHSLLFQTTPILIGGLIEANCVNCHQPSKIELQNLEDQTDELIGKRTKQSILLEKAIQVEEHALVTLLHIKANIQKDGYEATLQSLQKQAKDHKLPPSQLQEIESQIYYLLKFEGRTPKEKEKKAINKINSDIQELVGSEKVAEELDVHLENLPKDQIAGTLSNFIQQDKSFKLSGSLFSKVDLLTLDRRLLQHVQNDESFHNSLTKDKKIQEAMLSDIDMLTSHYQRGKELFISQACYACHRISGLSRGGVGPELTLEGKKDPWFIKQSIVWPQADLPTSTMPNMRLDHAELEDLTTFLMAQKGESKAISPFKYAANLKAWEEGKKQPWEEPISPEKIYNIDEGMMIFAEQGCAACHKLKGFESNVGFAIEKEKPNFEELYQEHQWFESLFPEDIVGSQIVNVLVQHGEEIDQRIVNGVREKTILERIEKEIPGLIESFYSPFEYAMRAKDFEFTDLLQKEEDQEKRKKIEKEQNAWKERVRRTLMIFIQEYGLGRLICPRLDWSGIYRSDEWLMEHFYKPTVHTAKSIMPVFPFDSTKFQALTYMLDVLAKRNRDAIKEIWDHRGFNPAIAYKIYCSQCHGEYLQGNGPVSEWIYPIPKNLHDPTFLKNLTRERVINSIIHGVKGTPMAPWGEIAPDKTPPNEIAVLSKDEIEQLTSWLFSNLPSGEAAGEREILKWKYEPEDVLKELKSSKVNENKIEDVFDVYPNPLGPEKDSYYIKKKFYTKENLEMGEKLFITNCSICHGKEGDGTGVRAATMREAKPRMLTNLDWLHTRDDLRLLRSIKYGVPGTSMTPWGDLTSALQRIQMVMYIRQLSIEPELRKDLASILYQVFTVPAVLVGAVRSEEYKSIEQLKNQLIEKQNQRERIAANFERDSNASSEIAEIYKKEFDIKFQLSHRDVVDNLLVELMNLLDQEKTVYENLGSFIIAKKMDEKFIEDYFNIIRKNGNRYSIENGKIQFHLDPNSEQEISEMGNQLIEELNYRITSIDKELKWNEAELPSKDRNELVDYLTKEIDGLTTMKEKMITTLNESARLTKKQSQLFNEYLGIGEK